MQQAAETLLYFAYGSNMCTGRLRNRVPSAQPVRTARLDVHQFRFNKRSDDGSGKGNVFATGTNDRVWGVIFVIARAEKNALDEAEGVGKGYRETTATVIDQTGNQHQVFLYVAEADAVDDTLRPYSWYKRFVVEGARQHQLADDHIAYLEAFAASEDPNQQRDRRNRAIAC